MGYPAVHGSGGFATSHFNKWRKTPVQEDTWRKDELAHKPLGVPIHDHNPLHAERISIPMPWDVGGWMLLALGAQYHLGRHLWLHALGVRA
jgi:hypothetical protein